MFTRTFLFLTVCLLYTASLSAQCPLGTVLNANELVVNPDFSAGNIGFTSDYTYCNSGGCLLPEATYAVGANPTFFHPSFQGTDHTTGTGNLMIVNGAGTPNTNVWCQTIGVNPNTTYLFSAWISSMVVSSPAILQFSINGIALGAPFTAPSLLYSWQQFNATWNSGSNTSASICILNQNTFLGGNDFGLDDISFHECSCNVTVDAGNDSSICFGESVTLNGSGNGTLTWTPSAGLSCTNCADPQANPSTTTEYYLTNTIGICAATDSVLLEIFPEVIADAGSNATICSGDSIQLLASGGSSYSWSPASGLSNSAVQNPFAAPVQTIYYTVNVTDTNNCSGIDSVQVTVYPSPDVVMGNDTSICNGHAAQLSTSGGVYYEWSPNAALDSGYTAHPLATPSVSTSYSVTVINAYGCKASGIQNVTVYPDFDLEAGPDTFLCQLQSVVLSASGASTYSWQPEAGLSCTDCAGPVAMPESSTTYTVIGTDAYGCTKETTVALLLTPDCSYIMMPNAFTPNGDGLNDVFAPLGLGIETVSFKIFNRWGKMIFSTQNPADSWDGTFESVAQPVDTYVYYLVAHMVDGSNLSKKGNVTLIR